MSPPSLKVPGWWIERLFVIFIALGLSWSIGHLLYYKYLPTPFYWEAFDTWMDWFNTAFRGHQPGAYDEWGTVYPPLSFVVLRFVTYGPCYTFAEQFASRECDVYGVTTLHIFYLINIVLTARTMMKIDRRTAFPRAFALTAGLPMLFALERGNIILLCYTCLLLAYGPLLKSARARWFFAACAINFKVYLVGTLLAQLLKRRWRWFEGATLATILVYLVTYAILGDGTPRQIYDNITNFSSSFLSATPLDVMYTSTYKPLLYVMEGNGFPIVNMLGSQTVELVLFIVPIIVWATLSLIGLAALATFVRPGAVPLHRVLFLSIGTAIVTSEAGTYTAMFVILFVFMEPFRGFGRIWSIVVCYILCIPADVPLLYVPPLVRESYLFGQTVVAEYMVGLLPFIRPALLLSIVAAMSLVTVREVWDQLRVDGWRLPNLGRRTLVATPSGTTNGGPSVAA